MKTNKQPLLTPPKMLVIGFALMILLGMCLLTLPIATVDGYGLSWLNALFTSTSATCVTGLIVVDTGDSFTLFGQIVILSLIQVGGLGFMTFATFVAFLFKRRISFRERLILQEALNTNEPQGIVKLARTVLLFTVTCELIGALLLALRFSFDMPIKKALYYGVFHAVSNFNNAGFDIMGNFKSLTDYKEDPVVTLTVSFLIILGGIGFIVVNDVLHHKRNLRCISLHSKVVITVTLILLVASTILIYILELHNPKTLEPLSLHGKWLSSFYQAVTPRTAGSNTLNITDLTQPTLFFTIILMFIGASPGSTGGGIKTTTFLTLIGAAWSQIKGKEDVVFFRQRIVPTMIYKALTVSLSAMLLVITVTMLLSITEHQAQFLKLLFEAVSAFGTVGLSMGLTPELTPIGKLLIVITMFIGRLGPLTVAIALAKRKEKEFYRYPKGKYMIG
ncbi:potassium uptake protein, TrkH family [Fictibacillus macauensis ZFHKF-1]|uniref:Potassium uptake protein, TrkH family n=1 Tax=Fictibacillus macauensis ZFHKF-1 TaxID=1196324 RepID=I8ALK2_9BACL|nr:TrkH family potassium uptake protein [Fictibacillus macauensis]EIT86479.1 potassium uptake protein, TrkH family [Fictibacillus macauensis ZFHKF-1]